MSEPFEEKQQEYINELKAQLNYVVENGQADSFRKEVYQIAKEGKLAVGHLVLLRYLRNAEQRFISNPRPDKG